MFFVFRTPFLALFHQFWICKWQQSRKPLTWCECLPVTIFSWFPKYFSQVPKYFSGFNCDSEIATYFETCTKVIHGSNYVIRICNNFFLDLANYWSSIWRKRWWFEIFFEFVNFFFWFQKYFGIVWASLLLCILSYLKPKN